MRRAVLTAALRQLTSRPLPIRDPRIIASDKADVDYRDPRLSRSLSLSVRLSVSLSLSLSVAYARVCVCVCVRASALAG